MTELQEELRQAVAESFELQMELEQTQDRLQKFEGTHIAQSKPKKLLMKLLNEQILPKRSPSLD